MLENTIIVMSTKMQIHKSEQKVIQIKQNIH